MSAKFLATYQGVVLRTNDPQFSGRVILSIPQILGSAESAWASPSTPTTAVPKVGDVVYVTFNGGDISYPVYVPAGDTGMVPKQPTALTLSTTTDHTPDGVALARVTASWTAPTENQDGSVPVDLGGYTTQYSYDGTTWSGGQFTMDPVTTFHSLTAGGTVHVRVASLSHTNRTSLFSTADIATTTSPAPTGTVIGDLQTDVATAQSTADGKNTVFFSADPPAAQPNTAGDIWYQHNTAGDVIIGQWTGAGGTSWLQNTLADAVLASLTVGKIVTGALAAGVRIIAGPDNGAHAEMTDVGFKTFAVGADGVLRESVRLGSGDNVLSIPNANGDIVASIEPTGEANFANVNSGGDPKIKGLPMLGSLANHSAVPSSGAVVDGWLDMLPRGVVAYAQIGGVAYSTNGIKRELSFKAQPGRAYRVTLGGALATASTANVQFGFYLSVATPTSPGGDAAGVTGSIFQYAYTHTYAAGGYATTPSIVRVLRCNKDGKSVGGELNAGQNRIMLGTNGTFTTDSGLMHDFLVEDIGPDIPDTDVANTTGVASASAQTVITKTYNTNGWATYRSSDPAWPLRGDINSPANTNGLVYQGTSSDPVDGNQRGLWTFPSMTADLSGASITKIEAYLFCSGQGTRFASAQVGVHGYAQNAWPTTGLPTLTAATTLAMLRGYGQWVTLPSSLYAGFQSGSYKGISVGPGVGNDYMYFSGTAPQIRATYTK